MVKTKLVDVLIRDGATLLRELDRQNFPVESMFWVHLTQEDYWRLVIASPLVATEGGATGYLRLNAILREMELAGVTLEDISLLDPVSPQFESFYSLTSASSRIAAGPEWIEFEEAAVYRWTGASVSAELGCGVSSEELHRFWEAERKRSNLPPLLISLHHLHRRRVTLRFHPRNGPLEGIGNIKKNFLIALHRPNAHPDCAVTWLT